MELRELKKILQLPYKTENWRQLLSYVFDHVQFLDSPIVIPTGDPRVKWLKQYGTVQLSDGKNLALFELTLNDNVNLIRNRVGLNELVKKYIDQDSYHGILSIFEQGKEDYRFTFTARNTEFDTEEGFIDKDTDTKRFTYILGKNESCRTAAERFEALSKTENKTINAVEEAFNVEKLSKSFFKEYIEQFNALVTFLKSKPSYYQAIFEKKETATRNFVKSFMGRLVFLKFIQKKGWLGVPVSESGWSNGDYSFLENQFKNFQYKNLFLSQFLNPLFYEALNVGNRPNDEFQNRGYKIPYLSGGLFDNDNPKENRIDFEERELTNLFDFFERYNFTIDENDLHDKEVGIDPEMLGHIFENLLEDNKDKGAFYTPKEIVRYMCQESLKEYLKTAFEKQNLWPQDEAARQNLTDTITAFVEKKESARIARYDKEIATALRDVKICDPAIGSGAFPMGLLNEIFTMIKNLHDESPDRVGEVWGMEGDTWQPNIVKQNIIQNSIYGVDIEPGAVDIARLRFWLSLVIEETEPKPLPHLDYKIVVGNSLVSKLEDTIIDIEWDLKPKGIQTDLWGNEGKITRKQELIRQITALQKQVFEPDSDEAQLSLSIRNKKIDLLVLQLEIMIDEKGVTDKPQGTGRNITEMTQKWLETKGWQQQIAKLKTMKQGNQTPLEFFDWILDFPEVMNPEVNPNPGFDIVIGNPPYINLESNQILSEELEYLKFETYSKRGDIYCIFYEYGIRILREKGVLTYITSNKWMAAAYGRNTRKFLLERSNPIKLIDFKETLLFDSATVFTNILITKKEKYNNILKSCELDKTYKPNKAISTYFKENSILTSNLDDGIWVISDKASLDINRKIESKSKSIKDLGIFVSSGQKTGCNEAFIINEMLRGSFISKNKKNSERIKPILRGRQISKYQHKFNGDYLIISPHRMHNNLISEYSDLFEHLLSFQNLLQNRGQVLNGQHHWLELDNNPSIDALLNYEKPKIIWKEISADSSFSYDNEGFYLPNTSYFLLGEDLHFLLGVLNSKISDFYFFQITPQIAGGSKRYTKQYVELLRIPMIKKSIIKLISDLAENVMRNKKNELSTCGLESQIDNLLYKFYNLTYDEVLIIEPKFNERMSRKAYEALEVE